MSLGQFFCWVCRRNTRKPANVRTNKPKARLHVEQFESRETPGSLLSVGWAFAASDSLLNPPVSKPPQPSDETSSESSFASTVTPVSIPWFFRPGSVEEVTTTRGTVSTSDTNPSSKSTWTGMETTPTSTGSGGGGLSWLRTTAGISVDGVRSENGFAPTKATSSPASESAITNNRNDGVVSGTTTPKTGSKSGGKMAAAVTTGLVAAYGFEEGSGSVAVDASGNNFTGSISNASYTGGRFGKSLDFNGSSSMVTVADTSKLDLAKGMTLEAWVRPTAAADDWTSVILKENTNGLAYGMYAADDAGNPPAGYVNTGGTDQSAVGTSALPLNTWTHLATTYNGTSLKFFVNGTQVKSTAVTGTIVATTGALRIGGNTVWGEHFTGQIDEVRVYNRALSQSEINTDKNKAVQSGAPPAPTANAGANLTGKEGTAVSFTGSATGSGLSYSWDFGDGDSTTGTLKPKHTYADNGSYTVTLTVTDALGRTATDTATVTVSNVKPTAGLTDDNPVDENSEVQISFVNQADPSTVDTSAGFKYSYDFNNDGTWDITDSTNASVPFTFTDNGSYTVRGQIKDKDGGSTILTNIVDVANVAPTASFSDSGDALVGATVTFSFSNQADVSPDDEAAGFKYSFDFNNDGTWDVLNGTLDSATKVFNNPGTYTVKGRIRDKDGGVTIYSTDVVISEADTGPTADAGSNQTKNEGASVSFSGSASGSGLSYAWDFGDGNSSSGSLTPSHTYTDDGSYTVTLTVTDTLGRTASDTLVVTVDNVAPTANFSNSSNPTTDEPVTFTFSNQDDDSSDDHSAGYTYSYDWDGDGNYEVTGSSSASTEHTFSAAGTYTVKGRITDKDNGSTVYTLTVVVEDSEPPAGPTADAGADQTKNEGASVSFDGDATGSGLSYAWDFGDGNSTSGTLTPTHTYSDDGSYTVTLTVTDSLGRTASDTLVVTVDNVAPTANFGNSSNPTTGSPVTFTFTSQNDASSDDRAAGYTYAYDWNGDGSFEVSGSTSATANHTYNTAGTYSVKGRITDKDGGSTTYTITVSVGDGSTAPASPTNLIASVVSQSEINLTWQLNDTRDTSVIIERKTGSGGTYKVLTILPGGENTYTDTSGWASTTYFYRVKASNSGGDSGYSAERSGTTGSVASGALALVTNLRAVSNTPTTATISFTDTNTGDSKRMYLLERSDDGVYYRVVASLGTSTSTTDEGLTPGATYWYRVRGASWNKPTSDYTSPATVTMPGLAQGAPIAPSGLTATAQSGTSVIVAWANNDASNPQFRVERALYNEYSTMTWTQVALTSAGATSFTDTGLTPERPYVYRVRAVNSVATSDFGMPASDVFQSLFGASVGVITASQGTGSPKTYNIGPGQTYQNIRDLNWSILGPGDTVRIHYKAGGYHEIFQIATRGTPSAWITITGVPDPVSGALPVIDGTNAILASQFQNHYSPLSGSGLLVIGNRPGFVNGYKPGYITVENLQFQNAYSAYTFTDFNGSVKNFGNVGAGVYLERADHVTLKGNIINNNGEGVFGAGQSGFGRLMTDITLDSNHIYGNGNANSYLEHNTYLEGIDTVYQFNRYGPLRSGSAGAGLKDRSVGTIIRYNYIEGGAHQLQLPEAQNQIDLAMTLPRYHRMMVYGNTLVTPPGNASPPIFYGGDQGLDVFNRKGILYLYNNTIVVRSNQSQVYKINVVKMSSSGETLDARNNILTAMPASGSTTPIFGLLAGHNNAYFGRNWVNQGYQLTSDNAGFTGNAAGTGNLIVGSPSSIGFVNPAAGDYHLIGSSSLVDAALRLPGTTLEFPIEWQYVDPHTGEERAMVGNAFDLGAYEFGV